MFDAYDVSLKLATSLRTPLVRIRLSDASLATQLSRAAASVPLNLSEGNRRRGKDRLHLFRVAAGSAAEVKACLNVAMAFDYASECAGSEAHELADRVLAMCWRLTHPKGR